MKNFCGNRNAVVFDDSVGWSTPFPHLAIVGYKHSVGIRRLDRNTWVLRRQARVKYSEYVVTYTPTKPFAASSRKAHLDHQTTLRNYH